MIISQELVDLLERLQKHYDRYGNGNLANQIIKVQEEVGEVAEAYVGWTGTNPRKGTTHSRYDIAMELADVIVTAALGILYTGHNVNRVIDDQMAKTTERLDDYDAGR